PQLCEAETAVISRLVGTHVQRLATIARGDSVCTTNIPSAEIAQGHHSQALKRTEDLQRTADPHVPTGRNPV
ncbi:MAG: transcriptional regulator, partial [Actinomycetota bacterium]|nr:transcriptional regulator [Actinomycetota bacterium]